MPSIAVRTVCTVAVLPVPMPIVTLPLPSVDVAVVAVLKVIVLPLTVRTEPVVIAVARSSELAPAAPTSCVAVVIATAVPVLSFNMAEPLTVLLVPGPSRLFAVAPVMAAA